jgi:voltage-dependent calcium channel T type alpha-1G
VALGVRRYIKDRWNQLDVSIVILSIGGIVLEEMKSDLIPINPTIIRVMRVLRIARGELNKKQIINSFKYD